MKQTAAPASLQSKTSSQPFFGRPAGSALAAEQAEPAFFSAVPFIQAKLTIGAPDDPYEREADAVAEQVVQRMAAPAPEKEEKLLQPKIQRLPLPVQRACTDCTEAEKLQKKEEEKPEELEEPIQRKPIFESNGDDESAGESPLVPGIQRKCAECEQEESEAVQRKPAGGGEMTASPDVASRLSASKGGGSPLSESVQSSMGGALGADLSGVRVHTGSQSEQLNRDLGAQAFTHGSDVYFGAGKFQPGTASGDRLLAHELVHVGQQEEGIKRQCDPLLSSCSADATSTSGLYSRYSASIGAGSAAMEPQLPESVPVEYIYEITGSALNIGTQPFTSLQQLMPSALSGVQISGLPTTLTSGNQVIEDPDNFALVYGAMSGTGMGGLSFLNPLPGSASANLSSNLFTRFAGPTFQEGGLLSMLSPSRWNLNPELAPRLGTGNWASHPELQIFQRHGISWRNLQDIQRALGNGAISRAGLSAAQIAMLERIALIHATEGGTAVSPLMSLSSLTPDEALQRLPGVATTRAYIIRVRINPADVIRVQELLRQNGMNYPRLMQEFEVLVAQDLRAGASGTRVVSITANPAGPLGGIRGAAIRWGSRGLIAFSAGMTIHQILTAKGPHRRETQGQAFGSFAGGTIFGGLAAGFCVGAGIATGGIALLACGIAGGLAGGIGGHFLGGGIGSLFDD